MADNKREQESKNTNEKNVRLYMSDTEISFCNAVSDFSSSDA